MYDHLKDKLEEELDALDKKVAKGEDLDEHEYDCMKKWAKTLVAFDTHEAMLDEYGEDGESEYLASRRGSYRRDSQGRYAREGRPVSSYRRSMYPYPMYPSYRGGYRGGYSYHGENDSMSKLQEAYENASSEQERKTIRRLMDQMEG